MPDLTHVSLIDRLLAEHERTGAMPMFSGGDHEDPPEPPEPPVPPVEQDDDPDELGEAGKAALKTERGARKAAEKSLKDAQDKLDAIDAKQRKADEDRAKKQGEWEELATKREADLADTTTKLTTATTELESLRGYVSADVEAVAKAVTDASKDNPTAKVLLEFHPGDDASTTDLIAWTKRAKAQLPELAAKPSPRGNGLDPKPGDGKIEIPSAVPRARMW